MQTRNVLLSKITGLSVVLVALLGGCEQPVNIHEGGALECGFEQTEGAQAGLVFSSNGPAFSGGKTQSDAHSRNGKYASQTTPQSPEGGAVQLQGVRMGETYHVQVWRKAVDGGLGGLSASGDARIQRFQAESSKQEGDWELIELQVPIEAELLDGQLRIAVRQTNQEGQVFFDDMRVWKDGNATLAVPGTPEQDQLAHIYIKGKHQRKINEKREDALEEGILVTGKKDWAKIKLLLDGDSISASMRLKGDWPDHFEGSKWSYRVKTKKKKYWKSLRSFSLQSPRTRHFLDEWVYHKMLEAEDVLTPRYEFVYVQLNDAQKGLYAYEEHFTKHLLEHKARRQGPILKFREDELWEMRGKGVTHQQKDYPVFLASAIEPFTDGTVLGDSVLREQFKAGQNLLNRFRFQQGSPEEIVDFEALAKYLALVDVNQAFHSLIWHNQRWYYNPITAKLEPVGFDAYTPSGPYQWFESPLCGIDKTTRKPPISDKAQWNFLFSNKLFFERYIQYVKHYASEEYLDEFLQTLRPQIEENEQRLQREYLDYAYDWDRLKKNGKAIRDYLQEVNLELAMLEKGEDAPERMLVEKERSADAEPLDRLSVTAYPMGKNQVRVFNFYGESIQVVGALLEKTHVNLNNGPSVSAYSNNDAPAYTDVTFDTIPKQIHFTLAGNEHIYISRLMKVPAPENRVAGPVASEENLRSHSFLRIKEKEVQIPAGSHTLNKPLYVPAGYTLRIEAGCDLNLLAGGRVVSFGQVIALGTEEKPITIRSTDGEGGGFAVYQTKEESVIQWTRFDNLNTIREPGWTITGAVTFYEADVLIDHATFYSNNCEDALNVVRSEFQLMNSHFEKTAGDAFDGDFSKGKVTKCSFKQIGNDGIDFSGSEVIATQCTMELVGDKAVSIGEQSTATLSDLTIAGAHVGVSAKDLSTVTIEGATYSDCKHTYAIFQKKPEYGSAQIEHKDGDAALLQSSYVEKGSVLILSGEKNQGTEELDVEELLY